MEEKIINGIKYRLDKDTLTAEVVWNDDEYSGNIVIPDTIVSDTVSYKVTSIGNDAFYECSSLTSITSLKALRVLERMLLLVADV